MRRRRRIDHSLERPAYKQLADIIRDQVAKGELEPGDRLPSEHDLMQGYDLSRTTVRQAFAHLRAEGAIVTGPRGSYVRGEDNRQEVTPSGAVVTARMPSEEERRRLAIGQGVPVLVVTTAKGDEVLPSDRWAIRIEAGE
ncbi:GntR family transcriptional regulator [Herbidospora mongoliensis]|uniref:GntR family transcriptional regulator n=1 Tax=Herbidospora mongoliensis TaxID=688067 RepID=UPI0008359CA3|nr:winged helix-turn-helix domain-containing protein [Herbidospora mongoliensis]